MSRFMSCMFAKRLNVMFHGPDVRIIPRNKSLGHLCHTVLTLKQVNSKARLHDLKNRLVFIMIVILC